MAMFRKGVLLAQHKEPAFSKPIVRFVNPQTDRMTIEREPPANLARAGVSDIVEIAQAAGVTDERDGKPLYKKLLRARERAVAVLVDAVDDEPYVSSRIAPLLQCREEVLGGLALCKQVAQTTNISFVVYQSITDQKLGLPRTIGGMPVVRLRGAYPAPAQSAKMKMREEKGRRLIVGTGALIHLYRAVWRAKRQSTTFITVAGSCVANPMNLEVSIGLSVDQVLERCGLSAEPTRVVCGGSMTGIAVLDRDATCVTHTTRAILAFRENKKDALFSCIGCGRCEQVCPAGLNPMYIHRFVENSYYANLRLFDAHMCVECGTCSYICPSRLTVAASVAKAKEYALCHFIQPGEETDELDG